MSNENLLFLRERVRVREYQFVILNLFQDLKRRRVRRFRNKFGMTGWRGIIE